MIVSLLNEPFKLIEKKMCDSTTQRRLKMPSNFTFTSLRRYPFMWRSTDLHGFKEFTDKALKICWSTNICMKLYKTEHYSWLRRHNIRVALHLHTWIKAGTDELPFTRKRDGGNVLPTSNSKDVAWPFPDESKLSPQELYRRIFSISIVGLGIQYRVPDVDAFYLREI